MNIQDKLALFARYRRDQARGRPDAHVLEYRERINRASWIEYHKHQAQAHRAALQSSNQTLAVAG